MVYFKKILSQIASVLFVSGTVMVTVVHLWQFICDFNATVFREMRSGHDTICGGRAPF